MIFTSRFPEITNFWTGNSVEGLFTDSKHLSNPNNDNALLYQDSATGRTITIGEHKRVVPRVAAHFQQKLGMQKGDVLGIFALNNIHLPAIHMGTLAMGAIVTPANVMYSAEDLAHQIRVAKPKWIVTGPQFEKVVSEAIKMENNSCKLLKLADVANDIDALFANDNAPTVSYAKVDGKTHAAYYCFSSGTSGVPKAVEITHYNIASNARQVDNITFSYFGPGNTTSCVLPMSHIFGLNSALWGGPFSGVNTVIFPRVDLEEFVSGVVKYKIGFLFVVPPIVLLLGKMPILDKYPEFAKIVHHVVSGAAPCSKDTVALFNAKCPNTNVSQGYGLTETSPVTHCGFSEDKVYTPGSIGYILSNIEVKLVDPDTQKEVGYNQRGEIWFRGPMVMKGYLNDPMANALAFEDGWFKTGDVAVCDDSGQFYIVDRIKELIKSNGHQVAPAELESILLTNPNVLDAAVIGVFNEDKTSEGPRAYIVLKEGSDAKDILIWFNKKVARHKRLWGGCVVVDVIPKSAAGKIQRNNLRKRVEEPSAIIGVELARI